MIKMIKIISILSILFIISACGSQQGNQDYTAFKNSKPKSILILPPVNKSVDVNAINSIYAQVTMPLAESGYYTLPVTLVNETLKQNGITTSEDAKEISLSKLNDIFNADAILYLTIEKYSTDYIVISSDTTVDISGVLVDGHTGKELWKGYASASSREDSNNNGGGSLIGMLVAAAARQVVTTATDGEYAYAGTASVRLLSAGGNNGILYGPRSPRYEP
ncbi:DUF799 domain-containing protein [Orbaceae bacterium ESL0727]|nr:DUF799 domain-containing protein [Orbaceae bacterium ESL0727]